MATRSRETSILFVKAVIDKLKPDGRCAIVLPNGFLFDERSRKVREDLLAKCNLHTIVRLPQGVFAPYTLIPVNLLFFDRSGPTKEVWYYQIDPPEGRKGYAKTRAHALRGVRRVRRLVGRQGPGRTGRRTSTPGLSPQPTSSRTTSTLTSLTLSRPDDLTHRPPAELVADLIATEQEILSLLTSLKHDLEG